MERQSQTYPETVHDFDSDYRTLMVLSGFSLMRESKFYLILNVMLIISVVILYVYHIWLAIVTMYIVDDKVEAIKALNFMYIMLVGMCIPIIRFVSYKDTDEALRMLKNGVFTYTMHEDNYYFIMKTRVDQIKMVNDWITKMCLLTPFAYTFLIPISQLVLITDDTSQCAINPYLPLPLYVPFETRTFSGYVVALVSEGLALSFVYFSVSSLFRSVISPGLQLIAQIEVLSASLAGLRGRAHELMARTTGSDRPLGGDQDGHIFRRCLYDCLMENVRHHHAILKLKKYISTYVEFINTLAVVAFSFGVAASIMLILEDPNLNIGLLASSSTHVIGYLQICWFGQIITDKSSEIMNSAYSTPWYDASKDFKVILNIMLLNINRPIVLRARIFKTNISLETYGGMMTSGYKIMSVFR